MIHGDIIFTQIGDADNAISAVTEGYRGARVDHVGVLVETQLGKFVLEAFPPEVRLTNIEVFLNRSAINDEGDNRRFITASLDEPFRYLIPNAIAYGLKQRDIPYDRRYLTDEAALYCSEILVDMFKHANSGQSFFIENPMSFRDTETGEIHPHWVRHYAYFGMSVPEGEPGSNPGDISKDARLTILEVSGNITGYEA